MDVPDCNDRHGAKPQCRVPGSKLMLGIFSARPLRAVHVAQLQSSGCPGGLKATAMAIARMRGSSVAKILPCRDSRPVTVIFTVPSSSTRIRASICFLRLLISSPKKYRVTALRPGLHALSAPSTGGSTIAVDHHAPNHLPLPDLQIGSPQAAMVISSGVDRNRCFVLADKSQNIFAKAIYPGGPTLAIANPILITGNINHEGMFRRRRRHAISRLLVSDHNEAINIRHLVQFPQGVAEIGATVSLGLHDHIYSGHTAPRRALDQIIREREHSQPFGIDDRG